MFILIKYLKASLITILFVFINQTSSTAAMTTNPFPGNPYYGSTHVSSPGQRNIQKNQQQNVQPTNQNIPNPYIWPYIYYYPYTYTVGPIVIPGQVYQFNSGSNSSYVNTETVAIPPIDNTPTTSYPAGKWVSASNGNIPDGAILDNNHPMPTYYCRAYYNGRLYYGMLEPDNGCFVKGGQSVRMHFDKYEVLVGQ